MLFYVADLDQEMPSRNKMSPKMTSSQENEASNEQVKICFVFT